MPARLVHQDKGMRPGCNRLRDLLQVQRHPLGRAARQHQASALAVSRADRAEDVSRLGSLIFRRCGAGAAFGPAPRDLVLLPDPRFIGEPDLYLGPLDTLVALDLVQDAGEAFLKCSIAPSAWA